MHVFCPTALPFFRSLGKLIFTKRSSIVLLLFGQDFPEEFLPGQLPSFQPAFDDFFPLNSRDAKHVWCLQTHMSSSDAHTSTHECTEACCAHTCTDCSSECTHAHTCTSKCRGKTHSAGSSAALNSMAHPASAWAPSAWGLEWMEVSKFGRNLFSFTWKHSVIIPLKS